MEPQLLTACVSDTWGHHLQMAQRDVPLVEIVLWSAKTLTHLKISVHQLEIITFVARKISESNVVKLAKKLALCSRYFHLIPPKLSFL